MNYEKFIAFRYLRSPRSERSISAITKISVGGIAIGVTALIVALSIMNGFERDLKNALIGANAHLTISSYTEDALSLSNFDEISKKIRSKAEVSALSPHTFNQALITSKSRSLGSLIRGIDVSQEGASTEMFSYIKTQLYDSDEKGAKGSVEEAQKILQELKPHLQTEMRNGDLRRVNVSGIIVGSQLAQQLSIELGAWITLMPPVARVTPMGGLPRAKRFQVVGFFESGMAGYDNVLAFIDIRMAQKIFKLGDNIFEIAIRIPNAEKAGEVKEAIQGEFSFVYSIRTWMEQNQNLFAVILLEKIGLAVILSLIILIAAFNIISSLIMLVIEKRKDIAILKSMGAKDKSIRRIFIFQGAVIGLMGTFWGEVIGISICLILKNFDIVDIPAGVYVGNRIPMYIEVWQLFAIALVSFLICFLVTIIPSSNAAKVDPVKGLRYE